MFKANTNMNVGIRFFKAYMWSITSYGLESWTNRENEKKNIETFEMLQSNTKD